MKPRPAVAPPPEQPPYAVWVGIDPGGTVGLAAIVVPMTGPHAHDIDRAKLIGTAQVSASTSAKYTRATARATMLVRVRKQLVQWNATHVVLEEPSTQTNSWKNAKGEGRATGTLFFLGAHFGLCLGAAVTVPWPARVWSYPPTTSKRARNSPDASPETLGWMQARAPCPTRKDDTLDRMGTLLRQLRQRPANGVLPTKADLATSVTEHELMALGVLNFHLLRERGKV